MLCWYTGSFRGLQERGDGNMMEIELDDRLAELHLKLEKARAVLACLSEDIFEGMDPCHLYTVSYRHYQVLSTMANDYIFEAEKDIRELREGE
jgi:hypothetical protein